MESASLGYKIFSTLTPNSPRHLSLVQDCVSLEDKLGCHGITQEVLDGISVCGLGIYDKVDCEDRLGEVPP